MSFDIIPHRSKFKKHMSSRTILIKRGVCEFVEFQLKKVTDNTVT